MANLVSYPSLLFTIPLTPPPNKPITTFEIEYREIPRSYVAREIPPTTLNSFRHSHFLETKRTWKHHTRNNILTTSTTLCFDFLSASYESTHKVLLKNIWQHAPRIIHFVMRIKLTVSSFDYIVWFAPTYPLTTLSVTSLPHASNSMEDSNWSSRGNKWWFVIICYRATAIPFPCFHR